jgi:hypothetical protein
MGPDHLLGTQGNLFDGPAVFVDGIDTLRFELDRYRQQPRLIELRIIKGIHIEGPVVLVGYRLIQNQIAPNLNPNFTFVLDPGIAFVGWSGFQCCVFVFPRQGSYQCAIFCLAALVIFRQEITSCCEIGCQADLLTLNPGFLQIANLQSGIHHQNFIFAKPFFGVFERLLPQTLLAGISGMHSFKGARQRNLLSIEFTHFTCDAKDNTALTLSLDTQFRRIGKNGWRSEAPPSIFCPLLPALAGAGQRTTDNVKTLPKITAGSARLAAGW